MESTICNQFFVPGKMNVLLDTYCAGSSGKGKLESYIIKNSNNCSFLATTNSANASHIVFDNGKEYMFKCLPSGVIYHEKLEKVFICPGAVFEIKTLFKEIEMCGIDKSKIKVHPKAGIIEQIDIDYEKGLCDLDGNYTNKGDGTIKTGSTCSGSGAAAAKKALRHKTAKYASDYPELADMVSVTELDIMEMLGQNKSGLLQVGQGMPLSLSHHRFGRNTTFRNVTVSAALNDAFLPPFVCGNVFGNGRVFPIKIANYKQIGYRKLFFTMPMPHDTEGFDDKMAELKSKYEEKLFDHIFIEPTNCMEIYSKDDLHITADDLDKHPGYPFNKIDSYSGDFYPDQEEITWEEVEDKYYGKKIDDSIKRTSLTKLTRRIATHSKIAFEEGITYNMPPAPYKIYVCLNFVNWIDGDVEGMTSFESPKVRQWIDDNLGESLKRSPHLVELAFLGTDKETDAMVLLPQFKKHQEYNTPEYDYIPEYDIPQNPQYISNPRFDHPESEAAKFNGTPYDGVGNI